MKNRFVRGRAGLTALGVAAFVAASSSIDAQRDDVTPLSLQPDHAVERRLDRGEAHRYALALDAGTYARVIVEQRGVDVIAEVRGEDDATIAEIQGEIGTTGEEQVELVAGVAGTYVIVIRPAPANAAGAYAIRVSDVRPAGNADRARQ
ncbi:MAG TPA: hypothetical protein VKD69_26995, partial [Vicinamibacterales bacterium]|nr:hypothetical protein [Vicinamibacterales bacterium]